MISNPIQVVRTLKGAPLSAPFSAVLFAMSILRQPVSEGWLVGVTGYTDKPVSMALRLLQEYGLVARSGRCSWSLCDTCRALPLGLALDEGDSAEEHECGGAESGAAGSGGGNQSRTGNSPAAERVSTRNVAAGESRGAKEGARRGAHRRKGCGGADNSEKIRDTQENVPVGGSNGNNSEAQPIWGGEEQKLNLQALREAGIYGVVARALCQQAHITPRYVDMHALKARQEGCNSGLLVCRLRDKDPCPETWRVGSPSHRYDEDGFRLTWLDEEDE